MYKKEGDIINQYSFLIYEIIYLFFRSLFASFYQVIVKNIIKTKAYEITQRRVIFFVIKQKGV